MPLVASWAVALTSRVVSVDQEGPVAPVRSGALGAVRSRRMVRSWIAVGHPVPVRANRKVWVPSGRPAMEIWAEPAPLPAPWSVRPRVGDPTCTVPSPMPLSVLVHEAGIVVPVCQPAGTSTALNEGPSRSSMDRRLRPAFTPNGM